MLFSSNRFPGGWFRLPRINIVSLIRYYPAGLLRIAWLEFYVCIFVLMVLAMLAASSYPEYVRSFKIAHALLGAPFFEIKVDMMVCRANTGQWPAGILQSSQWGHRDPYPISDNRYLNEVRIEKGAVHFTLADVFAGKTVTLRPAVPAKNPFGPVVWFCAAPLNKGGWTIAGEDRTDVPERYIPIRLR